MDKPVRQCAVCRQKRPKRELLRIVRSPEGIVDFDPEQKKPGRGLYVCANAACIGRAKSKQIVHRAFGISVPEDFFKEIDIQHRKALKINSYGK